MAQMSRWSFRDGADDAALLEPFAGAGTTLAVAASLGCNGIGIEIDQLT